VIGAIKKGTTTKMRDFRFGWYGDQQVGEELIRRILDGKKTATACPSYDPEEGKEGESLALIDKSGTRRGTIKITKVELRRWEDFDEEVANRLGMTLEEVRSATAFANSREMRPEEEMRITYFELVSKD